MNVPQNNDCLYFTVLFQGQRDIPQFTGQHTSYPHSRITVLLNPGKTAAAYCSPQTHFLYLMSGKDTKYV